MAWARLDDTFHDHPKVLRLGDELCAAVGLSTLTLTWAHRHYDPSNPGRIPRGLPARFAGADADRLIAALVRVGIWHEREDGDWEIHDFVSYLPPAKRPSRVKATSEARRAAGRKGAANRWAKRADQAAEPVETPAAASGGQEPLEGRIMPASDGNTDGNLLSDATGLPYSKSGLPSRLPSRLPSDLPSGDLRKRDGKPDRQPSVCHTATVDETAGQKANDGKLPSDAIAKDGSRAYAYARPVPEPELHSAPNGAGQLALPGTPPPAEPREPTSPPPTQTLLGEWIAACPQRPPERVIGHLSREIKQLLDEGIDTGHVRAGIAAWAAKDLSPSLLASFVNSVMNGHAFRPRTRSVTDERVAGWIALGNAAAERAERAERGDGSLDAVWAMITPPGASSG